MGIDAFDLHGMTRMIIGPPCFSRVLSYTSSLALSHHLEIQWSPSAAPIMQMRKGEIRDSTQMSKPPMATQMGALCLSTLLHFLTDPSSSQRGNQAVDDKPQVRCQWEKTRIFSAFCSVVQSLSHV